MSKNLSKTQAGLNLKKKKIAFQNFIDVEVISTSELLLQAPDKSLQNKDKNAKGKKIYARWLND